MESPAHAHLREWTERRVCIGLDAAKKGMVNINIYIRRNITFVFIFFVDFIGGNSILLKLCTKAP